MLKPGDEINTCDLTHFRDRYGAHVHDDACLETRLVLEDLGEDTYAVTDLMSGSVVKIRSGHWAELPILRRKAEFFRRLLKTMDGWENTDQGSAHVLLDRLLKDVDDYSFCGSEQANKRGPLTDPPEDRAARAAFDIVAPVLVKYRRDHGMGRPTHEIVQAIRETIDKYRLCICDEITRTA